jgi:hypothetical protein
MVDYMCMLVLTPRADFTYLHKWLLYVRNWHLNDKDVT